MSKRRHRKTESMGSGYDDFGEWHDNEEQGGVVGQYKVCHTGNVLAFQVGRVHFFGGGSFRDADTSKCDIILDLNDHWQKSGWKDIIPDGWRCKEYAGNSAEVLSLYITDSKAPPVGRKFWEYLLQDLDAFRPELPKVRVLVACMGGHGRTGVVLASLALAANIIPKGDCPVEWIRKAYCDKAVETEKQLDYLSETFSVEVTAEPRPYGYSGYAKPLDSKSDNKPPPNEMSEENYRWHFTNDNHSDWPAYLKRTGRSGGVKYDILTGKIKAGAIKEVS